MLKLVIGKGNNDHELVVVSGRNNVHVVATGSFSNVIPAALKHMPSDYFSLLHVEDRENRFSFAETISVAGVRAMIQDIVGH